MYLTDCWPLFFASLAARETERWAIVEIASERLDERRLQFDEDVLAQYHQARFPQGTHVKDAIRYCRQFPWKFPEFKDWQLSLKLAGSCAYYGIVPVAAITRILLIDPAKLSEELKTDIDRKNLTLDTFPALAERHAARLRWVLAATGKPDSPCDVYGLNFSGGPPAPKR